MGEIRLPFSRSKDTQKVTRGRNYFQKNRTLIFLSFGFLLVAILLLPHLAHAQEFEGEEGRRTSAVNTLGWVSVGSGVIGTGTFLVYVQLKKSRVPVIINGPTGATMPDKADAPTRNLVRIYKPVLNFHVVMNVIGYAAGIAHGYALSSRLDPIALALVIVMTASVATGIMLRFGTRSLKLFNIQVHGNLGFVVLLVILVGMHIMTARGD